MTPDFDQWVDRRHTNSLKWEKYGERDILPLWVADMDFRSPRCVTDALQQRVAHGVFGYGASHHAVTELLISRMAERYNWHIRPEWLVFYRV
ncbi:MAG: Cystathionine beta-lyase PatB [Candidatus Erwinia impunctatus]|nr:Cystathionine beta-lyase PatB [Culicoides impunctatus]